MDSYKTHGGVIGNSPDCGSGTSRSNRLRGTESSSMSVADNGSYKPVDASSILAWSTKGDEGIMTNKNLTEIIAIIDRSGSMEDIVDDASGGFNAFLSKQQKDVKGECRLTYVQFHNVYEIVHDGIPIQEMQPLDRSTFVPRASTALRDAIGQTINVVGARLANTPEEQRPGNIVVVILTDGQENSSREFSQAQIKQMIEHQTEKYGWAFVYLAQNVDAFATGRSLGLDAAHPGVYLGDVKTGGTGHRMAYMAASDAVSNRRQKMRECVSLDWSASEKKEYTDKLSEEKKDNA